MTEPEPVTPPEPVVPLVVVKEVIAKEVGVVVKEVIKTSDVSWIRRDWLVLGVLFVILGILSTVQIISLNRIEKSAQNTDLIAECTTPGTRCFKLAQENIRKQQEWQAKLTREASLCILLTSGAVNTGEIPFEPEPVAKYYDQCVVDRAGPPPPS